MSKITQKYYEESTNSVLRDIELKWTVTSPALRLGTDFVHTQQEPFAAVSLRKYINLYKIYYKKNITETIIVTEVRSIQAKPNKKRTRFLLLGI